MLSIHHSRSILSANPAFVVLGTGFPIEDFWDTVGGM